VSTPITPDGWPRGSGYAHGMIARGHILCTAGQIGWDPRTCTLVSADMGAQAAQALANVAAVLEAGGALPEHLVRLTWYVTDRVAYHDARADIGRAYRDLFGRHFPAMAVVVVAALLEPGALVEIEATAVIPDPPGSAR
jgi:enamine deaminase RidA (YjgF/YER057c/UK114 family)